MSLPMGTKCETVVFVSLTVLVGLFWLCPAACAQRRLAPGEEMPEFSATDLTGLTFDYKHGSARVLMVAFLSAKQQRAARAAADIEQVVAGVSADVNSFDVVVAVDDPNCSYFGSGRSAPTKNFHILSDAEFKLWGRFGVIATPTVIIADAKGEVSWVKAGYGYTFARELRVNLCKALGIQQEIDPNDADRIEAAPNDTVEARMKRHLQMARLLEQKDRLDSAIAQILMARQLDPNSVDAAIGLGELLCRAGHAQDAADAVGQVKTDTQLDKARVLLVSGWAKRQLGDLKAAENSLLEATILNPESSRALFELGKVYQATGQTDKAVDCYRKALAVVFGEATDNGSRPEKKD